MGCYGLEWLLPVACTALLIGCASPAAPSAFGTSTDGPANQSVAPDEERLGKSRGYPVGAAANYFVDESVRVGSFTHQGEIYGIYGGVANRLDPSPSPMPLPKNAVEPAFRWRIDNSAELSIGDYLARQRIMGLLIVKDGVVQLERYQYDRGPRHRFLSNSMAKSITAIAVGLALQEGKIRSLDDRADAYASKLSGTLYGETSIRDLLRMASGARFTERYDGQDDFARFGFIATRQGLESAAKVIEARETPAGQKFNYASAETAMLGAVVRGWGLCSPTMACGLTIRTANRVSRLSFCSMQPTGSVHLERFSRAWRPASWATGISSGSFRGRRGASR